MARPSTSPEAPPLQRRAVAFDRANGPALCIVTAIVFILSARLGLLLIVQPETVSPVWPASGVMVALMAVNRRTRWPWIVLGMLLGRIPEFLLLPHPLAAKAVFATTGMAETIFATVILTNFGRDVVDFSALRHFARLLIAAGPVCALAACFAAVPLVFLGYVPDFWGFWRVWLVGDGLGILLVTPLLLSFSTTLLRRYRLIDAVEVAVLIASCTLVAIWLFDSDSATRPTIFNRPFILMIPLLIWAGLRTDVFVTSVASLIFAFFSLLFTVERRGPFATPGQTMDSILPVLQVALAAWSSCGLTIAIAMGEKRRALAAIAESEQRFRLIAAKSPVGIFHADVHGMTTYLNEHWSEISGQPATEGIGHGWASLIHPDDREKTMAARSQAIAAGQDYEVEYRLRQPSGAIRWIKARAAALRTAAGTFAGYAGIVEDFTARKLAEDALRESEARFRTLIEQSPVAIGVARGGNLTYANHAFLRLYGISDGAAIVNRPAIELIAPECREELSARIRDRTLGLPVASSYESVGFRADGTRFPYAVDVVSVDFADGTYQVAFLTDLTERKRVEEHLRRRQEFDELVAGILARFSSTTGPDINNHILASLEAIGRFIGVEYCIIVQLSGDQKSYSATHEWHDPATPSLAPQYQNIPRGSRSWIEDQILGGKVVLLNDIDEIPPEATAVRAAWQREGRKSQLLLPLQGKDGTTIGCIAILAHRHEIRWQNEDIDRMSLVRDAIVNVLERGRAEEALRESESRFRTLIEQSPVPMAVSREGLLAYVNRAYLRLYGFNDDDNLVNQPLLDHVAPESRAMVTQRLHDRARGLPLPNTLECVGLHKDGTRFPYFVQILPVKFPDGDYTVGILTDLTERKRAEAQTQRRRQFDELVAGILARFSSTTGADIDSHIMASLEALGRFIGMEYCFIVQIAADRKSWSATHGWHEPDVPGLMEHYQNIPWGARPWVENQLLAGHVVQLNTIEDLPPEDTISRQQWLREGRKSELAIPLRGKGGITIGCIGLMSCRHETNWQKEDLQWLSLVRDAITNVLERRHAEEALRDSEARFRELIEQSPMAMGVSRNGILSYVNRAYLRLYRLNDDEDMVNQALTEHVAPECREMIAARIQERALGMAVPTAYECVGIRKDGTRFPYFVEVVPVRFPDGDYTVAVLTDLTDRKRAEALLVESEKLRTVAGLAAGIAHEINNPLAGMVQNAQVMANRLLQDTPPNSEAAKRHGTTLEAIRGFATDRGILDMIEAIRSSGRQASAIIQNLLSYSRGESQKSLVNLGELFYRTLELAAGDQQLKASGGLSSIEIQREFEPDGPVVLCHANQIQQVLMNLIRNAVQAMQASPGGRPHQLHLRTFTQRRFACLAIQDNGPGIPPDVRERIFEPFFTTKPQGQGTGLGLFVSYHIVKTNHGGSITVDPAPDGGTIFTISLPLDRPADATPSDGGAPAQVLD
jgi:PAS domain S-box-containing protein